MLRSHFCPPQSWIFVCVGAMCCMIRVPIPSSLGSVIAPGVLNGVGYVTRHTFADLRLPCVERTGITLCVMQSGDVFDW